MLTPRQQRFCEEYVIDFNGTQAAIRAGYTSSSAGAQAHYLLKNPNIRDYIEELKGAKRRQVEVRSDRILQALETMTYADATGFYDDNGDLLPPSEWPEELRILVSGIEQTEVVDPAGNRRIVRKIKLIDKMRAVEMLAKHKALLTDKVEVKMDENLSARLARMRSRS